jgi:2-oxoglutarate dehydrogenase E1 component
MTPKSLLRHKMSVSPLSDLSSGRFELIIPEIEKLDRDSVKRLVFCSGKVYYDLLQARKSQELSHVALIRIEQTYPFPIEQYEAQVRSYPNAGEIVWCQEEPQNQGAWYQIRHRLQEPLGDGQQLYYAGRESAAAPACGILKLHIRQQQELVEAALGIEIAASKSDGLDESPKKQRSKRRNKPRKS